MIWNVYSRQTSTSPQPPNSAHISASRVWPANAVRPRVRRATCVATVLSARNVYVAQRSGLGADHAQSRDGFGLYPRQRAPFGKLEPQLLVAQLPVVAFLLQVLNVVASGGQAAGLQQVHQGDQ